MQRGIGVFCRGTNGSERLRPSHGLKDFQQDGFGGERGAVQGGGQFGRAGLAIRHANGRRLQGCLRCRGIVRGGGFHDVSDQHRKVLLGGSISQRCQSGGANRRVGMFQRLEQSLTGFDVPLPNELDQQGVHFSFRFAKPGGNVFIHGLAWEDHQCLLGCRR